MRKKSGKLAVQTFKATLDRIEAFVSEAGSAELGEQSVTWVHEAALIKIAVAFESLMLGCLVVAINNDSTTISEATKINFPQHMNDEVCEYLITGGGYFNFRGTDGLLSQIERVVPRSHWLYTTVKDSAHKQALNRLIALRNYAAHEGTSSKRRALKAVGQTKIGSAGSWLKVRDRFALLLSELRSFAGDLEASVRY